jgi:hypothetical protein
MDFTAKKKFCDCGTSASPRLTVPGEMSSLWRCPECSTEWEEPNIQPKPMVSQARLQGTLFAMQEMPS